MIAASTFEGMLEFQVPRKIWFRVMNELYIFSEVLLQVSTDVFGILLRA